MMIDLFKECIDVKDSGCHICTDGFILAGVNQQRLGRVNIYFLLLQWIYIIYVYDVQKMHVDLFLSFIYLWKVCFYLY